MTTKPTAQPLPISPRPRLTRLPDPPQKPDMQEQSPYVSRAYLILEDHFIPWPDVFVGTEGWLCYDANEVPSAPRPDCLVAIGIDVPRAELLAVNGYTISEIGKPPDFVLEVASRSTGQRDYNVKRGIYAGYGVREYWRFDHTGGRYHDVGLAGDRLVNGEYEPIPVDTGADGIMRGYSTALDLELHWYFSRLRFWDPKTREYLPDLTEAKAQRDDAVAQRDDAVAQRDDAVAQQDDAVAQRDDAVAQHNAAEERIRQLEAELRRRQGES